MGTGISTIFQKKTESEGIIEQLKKLEIEFPGYVEEIPSHDDFNHAVKLCSRIIMKYENSNVAGLSYFLKDFSGPMLFFDQFYTELEKVSPTSQILMMNLQFKIVFLGNFLATIANCMNNPVLQERNCKINQNLSESQRQLEHKQSINNFAITYTKQDISLKEFGPLGNALVTSMSCNIYLEVDLSKLETYRRLYSQFLRLLLQWILETDREKVVQLTPWEH